MTVMIGDDPAMPDDYAEDQLPEIGVKNAPARIWMCVGDLGETSEWDELTSNDSDVTWCDAKQDQYDVEYVRADLVRAAMPNNWADDPDTLALAKALQLDYDRECAEAYGFV